MLEIKDEEREDLGVVSFAILGVLIILLSIFAAAYISRIDRINYENELRNDKISQLEYSIDDIFDSIENKIKYIGIQSVFDEGVKSDENTTENFQSRIDEYFQENSALRGWEYKGTSIKIEDYNLVINPKTASVDEITPEDDPDVIKNDSPGVLKKRNTTFYYEILGQINLTAFNDGLELDKSRDISVTIDVPAPFMRNKMDSFGTNLRGDKSHLARITEYMLTTLAQYRTLVGYGMQPIEDESGNLDKTTNEIIKEQDVELAVNLALLFEIAYHYRSYDPDHLDSILNNVSYLKRDNLEELLINYLHEDSIDPGDIISLYHRYSYDNQVVQENDSVEIDIGIIVAQAMNALVDQFVLKHLENLKVTPVLDLILSGVEIVEDIYESVTDLIFGDDEEDEVNLQQVQVVKEWVRSVFISSGLMDTSFLRNYYGKYDRFQGEKIAGYPNLPDGYEFTDEIEYYSRLDGEEYEWYGFSCGHGDLDRKRGHTCDEIVKVGEDEDGKPINARCGAEEIKLKHDFRHGNVHMKVKNGPVSFQPVDILDGNDEVWQDFYDDHFKSSVDENPEDVSDAVKEVITEFVGELVKHDKIKEIIREYNNIKVDPTDEVSFMKDIQVNIDSAIHDVIEHFRKNPDEIAEILKEKLHNGGDPKVDELIYFLNYRYDDLVTRQRVKQRAARKTADRLTAPNSAFLEISDVYRGMSRYDENMLCDFSWNSNRTISKNEASDIIQNGNIYKEKVLESLYEDIRSNLDEFYQELKKREVHISDSDENISQEDGLIVQALNHYQFNTSYESENHTTRSGNILDCIEEISPNPATQDQDTVYFRGNTSIDYKDVEWKSNLDGHLSNKIEFNRSARFMTSGSHEITLKILEEGGSMYEDKETLFINIPPIAEIDDVSPNPATESQEMVFTDSSSDPDGFITERLWKFGDGNSSIGTLVNHTYTQPGHYTVSLTVTDDKGGRDTVYKSVLVDDAPKVIDIIPDSSERLDTYAEIEVIFSESVDPSSLEYSIDPFIEFNLTWKNNNRTLILESYDAYPRDTKIELVIEDIKDVDNGTSSSLLKPVSENWQTIDKGEIVDIYPDDTEAVDLQRSIVLVLDEPGVMGDIDNFVDHDWNWTYNWDHNNTHLTLDHDEFPSGTKIDLNFDFKELRAIYDDSSFLESGENSTTLTLHTKSFDNPNLLSSSPENKAEEVKLQKHITFTFDKPINASSFNLTTNPDVEKINYDWSSDRCSVLITHDGFSPYQKYSFFIEAECEEGLQLSTPVNNETSNPLTFTTEDTLNPKVLQTSPKDGTEHYLSNSPVIIQFDKKMDPESLDFNCHPNPGYWKAEWNDDGRILILHHGGFDPGRRVDFVLNGASDIRGSSLSDEVHISFKISNNGEHIEGNLFQRKLWSFIGGGPYSESLFDITEAFMRKTTSNMIVSAEMSNLEYRIPLNTENNFDYSSLDENNSKELKLLVDLDPGYLHLDDILEISDPKGHHFTEVTTISSRPFKTEWNIIIPSTEIFLDVKRDTPYILGKEEPKHLSLNETYEIEFNLSISVASGWALEDVDYTRDDIDLSTVIDFLDKVWDLLKEPLSYLLDGLYKILELFDDIVNRLKEHAASLVEYLGEMVRSLVNTTLRNLAETILDNRERLQDFAETLSLLGIPMGITVYEDGNRMKLPNTETERDVFLKLGLGGAVLGTTLDLKLYVLEDNVVATGILSSDSMDIIWQIDPFAEAGRPVSVYDSWFQTQGEFGEKGDGALLNLEIPEIETEEDIDDETYEYSTAEVFPALSAVSIPIGPVVVSNFDFGLEITYVDLTNVSSELIHGSIKNAFWDTVEHMRDSDFNLDYIVEFVRTFTDLLLEELIRFLQSVLDSIELFFSCTVNQMDIIVSFGLASADGVLDFIRWIGQQVRHLLQSIVERRPNCNVDSLPSSILEETELSVEVGLEDASTVEFSVNVPALASIIGKDLGEWRIEFGLELGNGLTLVDGQLVEW